MSRLKPIILILFALLIASSAFAKAPAKVDSADEPEVTITPPPSYKTREILFLPLEIPTYVIRGVLWPIGQGLTFLERKHAVDRVLDFLSNKDKTLWVYPIIEGGAGSGFGGGLGVSDSNLFNRGYTVNATYRIHVNMDQHATFATGKPDAIKFYGQTFSYMFSSDWQRITSDDFYGIGNGSLQSAKSEFRSDRVMAGFILPFTIFEEFSISPHIATRIDDATTARNNPQVTATFPPPSLPGYGQWLYYLDAGINATHDTTDSRDDPHSGGIRTLGFKRLECLNTGGFNYNQYDVDVRQYFKLWRPGHVLILRAAMAFQQATGGQIPFWQQSVLDAGSPLRGFPRGRFRDRDSMIGNIEYRFPLWDMLRGVIFLDLGRVFHSPADIAFNGMKYSAGGGVHLKVKNIARFRFEAAYGGEGVNIMFGTSRPL